MSTQPHSRMPSARIAPSVRPEPVEGRAAVFSPDGARPISSVMPAVVAVRSLRPNAPSSRQNAPRRGSRVFWKKLLCARRRPAPHSRLPGRDAELAGRWHHGWSGQGFGLLEGLDAWYRSGWTGRDREVAPDGAADRRGRGVRALRGRGRPGGGAAGVAPQGVGNPGGVPQPPQAAGRPERGRRGDHPGAPPARGPDDRRAERRTARAGRKADGQHAGGMRPDDRGRSRPPGRSCRSG